MSPDGIENQLRELREHLQHEVAERERASVQVRALLEVAARIVSAEKLDDQLQLVAEGIVKSCDFQRCVITLFDAEWRVWKRAHAGLSEEAARSLEESPSLTPEARRRVMEERYRIGNSYFVPHDSNLGSQLSKMGVSSSRSAREFVDWHPEDLLFVPLIGSKEKILGAISVDDPSDGRRPTAEGLNVLELFAREAAFALEQALLLRELRRTEGYLENLVTNSADAIVTTDPDGVIVVWNEGAVRMLGWQKSEMLGQHVAKVYGEKHTTARIMRKLMAEQEGGAGRLVGYETVLVSKAGERIPVSISVSALYDDKGQLLGTAGISRDLRPWKRLEQELVAAEKAATLSEVACTLCHEINNFLEEILSAGQISQLTLDMAETREMYVAAGKEGLLEKEMERLSVISREALKIAGLTNQLQGMARGEAYDTAEYVGEVRMLELKAGPKSGENARVLVADDRRFIREFLKDFLVLEGFEVDTAEDGREALEKVRDRRYDLVLSDIKMPHKNGYEVFAGVKEISPDTKVILMTAYGYDPSHSIVKSAEHGLSSVLFKPFQMAQVRDKIVAALYGNGQPAENEGPGPGGDGEVGEDGADAEGSGR